MAVKKLKVWTQEVLVDAYLRTYRMGAVKHLDVSDPYAVTAVGTEIWLDAQATAELVKFLDTNLLAISNEVMPDSASAEELDRHCAVWGITRRGAKSSVGYLALSGSGEMLVADENELTDDAGATYYVTLGGTFSDDALIAIASREGGVNKNLEAGAVLRWKDIPAGSEKTAVVSSGGLTGGADAENDVTLRNRLYAFLRQNPGNGNWVHLKQLAEESSSEVTAFCYQAFQGPGTTALAVVRPPTDTNKNRDVDSSLLNEVIIPYVEGLYPAHMNLLINTVTNVPTDVTIGLSLGTRKGWKDRTPFPGYSGLSGSYCDVTVKTSDTVFRVRSTTAPSISNRVAWWSQSELKLYRSKCTAVEISSNLYELTLESPFLDIAVGDYVMPDCESLETYIDAVLSQFANLGPGEVTEEISLEGVANRRPEPTEANPYSLGPSVLKFLSTTGNEVLDVQYLYRSTTTPALPIDVEDPPNILTPRRIAFYKLTE